ncbi:uncharacterized protein HKW66_Vig0244480 [Vigna angularis]|uniref:Uncharacterized protein n=1 Tax=Phaseolus angularis TaxID=3914 RepID=A0A8T0KZK2_PHAAN|nr:uncharacterized protein HKW66_Vig0244480 [Vigna angularis]
MLVLLLKALTFVVVTLWSLLTCIIFNAIACTFALLLQCLKGCSEATLGIFQVFSEGIKTCFEFILQLVFKLLSSLVSKVFDIVIQRATKSLTTSVTTSSELVEKLKTALEEPVNEVLPKLYEELFNVTVEIVKESWKNYNGAKMLWDLLMKKFNVVET